MALETATYISDLNTANPTGSDAKSTADDHLRLIKSAVKTTFPNVTGAVTVTHTDLNTVTGKAPLLSPALTGTPTVPGDTGKVWASTGTIGGWSSSLKSTVMRLADGADASKLVAFSLSGLTTATTRTITIPNKSGTLAMTSDGFASAEQTITAASALTIAHGLGAIPRFVLGYLKCVSAESNYSIGDVLCVPLGAGANGTFAFGVSVVADATNLNVRYGSDAGVFVILDKTTGGSTSITAAKWTFSLRAYA